MAVFIGWSLTNPLRARRNPENYVFFVAHMYHLFGTPGDTEGIDRQWDFEMRAFGMLGRYPVTADFQAVVPGSKTP